MFKGIKSLNIFKEALNCVQEGIYLKLFKYNTKLKKKFDLTLEVYEKFSNQIVIEIKPDERPIKRTFINYIGAQSLYHIYFNDNKQERKEQKIYKKDKVGRIKIIIDQQNNAFFGLFKDCKCIQKIKFIKFNRNDINNMSLMFFECSSLKEIDLSHFNTEKVTKMFKMFYGFCSSKLLRENPGANL